MYTPKKDKRVASRALTFLGELAFVYKLGLAVIITGLLFAAFSGIFGGVLYKVLMGILGLLGAPEERYPLARET